MSVSVSPYTPPVPIMDRAKFAAEVGVTPAVVEGWIRHGYLRTVTIGRRSLLDLRSLPAQEYQT